MTLKFNDQDIELKWSFRSNIYFEQIQGKNLDFSNLTTNDLLTLFYCCFIATLQKNKKEIIALTDFLDVLDDNGGEKCLYDFSNWYIQQMTAQYDFVASTEDKDKKPAGGPEAAKKKS